MNELKRLVRVIEKRVSKGLHNFIDLSQDNLETRLYLLVQENRVEDDAAAIKALYHTKINSRGYKMLKSRLKKKLYAAVDSIELNDVTLKPSAHLEKQCLILHTRAYILLHIGEKALALKVLAQAIAIAKELSVASLLVRCYDLKLSILHSLDDYISYIECEKELENCRGKMSLELDAKIKHLNSSFSNKQTVAGRKELLNQMPSVITYLEQKWEESGSPRVFEYLHMQKIQYYELVGDYEQIIRITENAENLVAAGVVPKKMMDMRFNRFMKLFALLQLRIYDAGLRYAQAIESSFHYGSANWAAFMENYFLLALQSQQYKLASGLLDKFSAAGALSMINDAAKERWILYIKFYALITGEDICPDKVLGEDATALLKQTVKDKQGYNVAIIILETFDLLKKKDIEDASLYSDRIRKYISKHLIHSGTERARLFLKLLLVLLKENRDAATCRVKGRYLLQKLKNTPLPGNAFAEVEIVPYEQLWEQALNILADT